jgi:hypothetical protein
MTTGLVLDNFFGMATVFDAHDDRERAQIKAILSQLPEDHPAWDAHKGGADAISLTYLVGSKDMVAQLTRAWLEGYRRMLHRSRRFQP